MRSKHDLKLLLQRFVKGTASPQEREWIEEWYDSLERENKNPSLPDEIHRELDEMDWKVILHKIHKSKPTFHLWRPLAAAAAVLIFAACFVYMFTLNEQYSLDKDSIPYLADKKKITNETTLNKIWRLSDSTEVTLTPNSSLTISGNFNNSERKVYLVGEAFFNVAHNPDKPFYVYANTVVTKVVGTSFNVETKPGEKNITVAVKTGKVWVYKMEGLLEVFKDQPAPIILTANHQVTYNMEKDLMTPSLVKEPEMIISKEEEERIVRFDATPVEKIFDTLERMYGVEIQYDRQAFQDRSLTITIAGQGLFDRIDSICEAIEGEYVVENGIIKIKKSI